WTKIHRRTVEAEHPLTTITPGTDLSDAAEVAHPDVINAFDRVVVERVGERPAVRDVVAGPLCRVEAVPRTPDGRLGARVGIDLDDGISAQRHAFEISILNHD